MEQLFSRYNLIVERTPTAFVRYLYHQINWDNRLIAIVGARGVGKTTMLFQRIKLEYPLGSREVLYASLDQLWFTTNTLLKLADQFYLNGGKVLFLDEVHKYPNWSQEIKNIYDLYPDLKIVFTGSSMLDIFRGRSDLSRRALKVTLYGLSFREFIQYEHNIELPTLTLNEIISNHVAIATSIASKIKPVALFKEYLKYGYFPFYKEDREGYLQRLLETINTIIEVDIPANINIELATIYKIKKLFAIIATLVPFTPNISQLAAKVETTRPSLLAYLEALEKAKALLLLNKQAQGLKRLAKPEKIYLSNTNYAYALDQSNLDIGNLRETFFYSQLQVKHKVTYSNITDFIIDEAYHFEIGGKTKGEKQISSLTNAYIAKDDIEVGYANQIPLWLFGLLY